jgi:hypothetical protein
MDVRQVVDQVAVAAWSVKAGFHGSKLRERTPSILWITTFPFFLY